MLFGLLALLSTTTSAVPVGLGDSQSAVQGLVHIHRQDSNQCSGIGSDKEEADKALAAKAQIVVIRGTGEDVRWLDALPEIPAIVYNRNGLSEMLPKPRPNLRVVAQQNIGREDDAMLRHIINNYDNLAEVTMFLQGWPFWHCAATLDTLRRTLQNAQNPVDPDFKANGAQKGLVPLASTFFQYSVSESWLGSWIRMARTAGKKQRRPDKDIQRDAVAAYNGTCNAILGGHCPDLQWVSEGSQWAVSRERIRSRPLEYYQRILNITDHFQEGYLKRLRGLVLEAVWPQVWGVTNWFPGDAAKRAFLSKSKYAKGQAEALGNYCVFGTDRGGSPSARERMGLCELGRHAEGVKGGALMMQAEEKWSMTVQLRPVRDSRITKESLGKGGHFQLQVKKPKSKRMEEDSLFCKKNHIWPIATITRLRNRDSGRCVTLGSGGLSMAGCRSGDRSQQWVLISGSNGGYHTISDRAETLCVSHDWAGSRDSNKCGTNVDGTASEHLQWELVEQGKSSGSYQIKAKNTSACMIGGYLLAKGQCQGPASVWQLSDAADMGQYWEKFDLALVAKAEGAVKMRCSMHYHSSNENAAVELVEPEWQKRGRRVAWTVQDAGSGSYHLLDSAESGPKRYLSCANTTGDAVLSDQKAKWYIHSVNESFALLESGRTFLQFVVASGDVRCSPSGEDNLPPQDSAFAMELLRPPTRSI